MDNFAAKHGAWQQFLGKEKKARLKGTLLYYGKKGGAEILAPKAPPAPTVDDVTKVIFDRLYQSSSTPALPQSQTPSSQRSRRPLASCSTGLLLPDRAELTSGLSRRSTASRTHSSRPGSGASNRDPNLLFFNDQQRQRTPSLRSMSQFSATSSLWQEVEKAVQEEVAKVVKPLQEQLLSEEQARKRAEEALRLLNGADANVKSEAK
eukprot:CAMPEP_0114667694 /NCGR_PEP_ID=MMETSP0191-20121206/35003_1 /TAXON_ID=126664 /ORGANISM="Sorites sp." /LENGTH=206 /DNA_ID=CAMNT_0001918971 /DNA_START=21 /DNA_END=641 /DNA_ORIENTATION=+